MVLQFVMGAAHCLPNHMTTLFVCLAPAIAALTLEERIQQLERRTALVERENEALRRRLSEMEQARDPPQVHATVSPLGDLSQGRQLQSGTCCRWTHDSACGSSITAQRFEKCTSLHEYLEDKTTTHTFDDLDSCLSATESDWGWSYEPTAATPGVTLKRGSSIVSTVPTPIKVVHTSGCSSAPTMHLQMNTVASTLTVTDLVIQGNLTAGESTLTFLNLPLAAGYEACDADRTPKYAVQSGLVYLKGCIQISSGSFASGASVATLPSGHRPPDYRFSLVAGGQSAYPAFRLRVAADGVMQVYTMAALNSGSSPTYFYIDSVVLSLSN